MGPLLATHDGTLKLLAMPGVTLSNLSRITEALYLNPVACRTRRQLGKDLEQRFEHVLRTIQLDLAAGGCVQWPIAPLQTLLPEVVARRPAFRARFIEALAEFPNAIDKPWRMCTYTDEITPGNVLRLDNKQNRL